MHNLEGEKVPSKLMKDLQEDPEMKPNNLFHEVNIWSNGWVITIIKSNLPCIIPPPTGPIMTAIK
jgi:hypothetical protein